jgi:hypothetical protein
LGVVRIYSRKTKYLLEDASETLIKIRTAFQPTKVDMPAEQLRASAASITVAEVMSERDLMVPSSPMRALDRNAFMSRPQDITLKETFYAPLTMYSSLSQLMMDDEMDPLAMDMGNNALRFDLEGESSMFSVEVGRDARVSDVHVNGVDDVSKLRLDQQDVFGLDGAFGPDMQDLGDASLMDVNMDVSLAAPSALDVTLEGVLEQHKRTRKRRWVDAQVQLSDAFVRNTLNDTSDIRVKRRLLDASSIRNMLHIIDMDMYVGSLPFGYDEVYGEVFSMPHEQEPVLEQLRDGPSLLDAPDMTHDMLELPLDVGAMDHLPDNSTYFEDAMDVNASSVLRDVSMNTARLDTPKRRRTTTAMFDQDEPLTTTVSKSTEKAVEILRDQFASVDTISLDSIIAPDTLRSDAARMFFEVLVLGTKGALDLKQQQPFGPIHVQAQPRLFEPFSVE